MVPLRRDSYEGWGHVQGKNSDSLSHTVLFDVDVEAIFDDLWKKSFAMGCC